MRTYIVFVIPVVIHCLKDFLQKIFCRSQKKKHANLPSMQASIKAMGGFREIHHGEFCFWGSFFVINVFQRGPYGVTSLEKHWTLVQLLLEEGLNQNF